MKVTNKHWQLVEQIQNNLKFMSDLEASNDSVPTVMLVKKYGGKLLINISRSFYTEKLNCDWKFSTNL